MSVNIASDLPDYFPDDLPLRLQNSRLFEHLHDVNEKANYFFSLGHRAVKIAGEPAIDNEWLTEALLKGVETYEIVAAVIDSRTFSGPDEALVVHRSLLDFVGDVKKPDDFFAKTEYAQDRLEQDAPHLAEVVHEITGRYVDHDKVAQRFALRGAAVMRAMHIHIDRCIAA